MENLSYDDLRLTDDWSDIQYLQHQNRLLENKVVELTTKNQKCNEEMNALLHAISHDLRAPLRAIDGYSRILAQDYSSTLDLEGQRFLHVICDSTRNMDSMINDLLSLSRVGIKELTLDLINMSAIVKDVIKEFSDSESFERIEFSIEDLPEVYGDLALIRVMWKSLISNAIKFSLPREKPQIFITGSFDYERCSYKIKDNGVGFNPVNKDALFEVFKRLHKVDEFPGSGIGLAIVQRIIRRHHGEIWGNSQPGAGAEFCFSLPLLKDSSMISE